MRRKRVFPKKTGKPSSFRSVGHKRRRIETPAIATTEAGPRVRSKLESYCVDYFHQHGISFHYEPLLLLAGRKYRPDFYLPDFDLFVEICGYSHMPFYVDRIEEKRKQYIERGLKAVFIVARSKPELLSKIEALFNELASKRG